jgi:uncharacterized protein YggE
VKFGRQLVLMGTVLAAPLAAQGTAAAAAPMPAHIETSGQGEVRVTPDRATVYVGVQTRASTAAVAAADNARRQKAIIDSIKVLGITAEQISTQNYSVNPEMQYDPQGRGVPPKVTGYSVTNTVRVELRRIDQVASVIDAALAKGANQVNGVEFSVSNADEARRTALAQAVTRAKADAEALARAAGGSLGALVQLSTSGPVYRPVFAQSRQMDAMSMAAAPPTPIEPGQQSVTAFVNATWLFVR